MSDRRPERRSTSRAATERSPAADRCAISDGLAQLSGASTLPAHRRRGVQSALLRARLLDAADSGCDLAVVTTEPASKSQQNVQRAGFALLYARAVLIRPVTSFQ